MKKIKIEYVNPFGAGILCGSLPKDLLENFEKLSKEVLEKKTLEAEDIFKLKELFHQRKLKDVLIKQGIPFVPSFVFGYVGILFGNSIFQQLVSVFVY